MYICISYIYLMICVIQQKCIYEHVIKLNQNYGFDSVNVKIKCMQKGIQ